jgi:predicted helicase
MSFNKVLEKYRKIAFSEKDKGERFERLMKAYLLTDRKYADNFKKVWMWSEFPSKADLGGNDTGIDLVALTNEGDYWAIQCKCYKEGTTIDKKAIDTFFTTSGRTFKGEDDLKTHSFSYRLWIDTTGKAFTNNAVDAFNNQNIPSGRLALHDLKNAQIDWEKLDNGITGEVARINKKIIKPHQTEALTKAHEHFKTHDRGKLIMACGTGKTFNSLRIAENETNGKGLILFLVPSIALLGQTLNEWYADALEPINAICICSDPEVTKKRKQLEDIDTSSVVDLAFPASTSVISILKQFESLETSSNSGLTVVFSTYQSIEVIALAQKGLTKTNPKYAEFDLIICDEAHRTTGVSLVDEEESSFVKVHNNDFIKAKKRLYMTATPRLYDANTQSRAAQAEATLWSMDDKEYYGEEIYRIGFGEAVKEGLLTDYKVLILTLNENDVPKAVQKALMDSEHEINTDDASKLIGCINALSKQILGDEGIIKETDPEPMRRAVAFCQSIAVSKKITASLNIATESYIAELPTEKQTSMQLVSSKHVDGTMNATDRNELLSWLKDEPNERECRVLTNVRCLSEGVDVPSLDAVLFLSARNSQVDVVQSVGRVMRKSPGKNYGYIIIPIVVPPDVEADKALDDNERYKVVWTVLNALRAHDDRFNATVNKIELNKNRPAQILVGRPEISFDKEGNPIYPANNDNGASAKNINDQLSLQFQQLQSVVFARMVQKVGERGYWEQWAKSVAEIATRQIERISTLVNDGGAHQKAFDNFLKGLHKNINPSISQKEAIEMLSQHIITKPVFDALFEDYSFVKNNPMSQSMQKMLDLLEEHSENKDSDTLNKFYEFAQTNIGKLDNAEAKQKIIIRLYDSFFKIAFPKLVEKLGIVYSPIEVVDFIIYSVNDILIKEFGRTISDENVHLLDPFTGTGTFITRLLQSGLINKEDLLRKYTSEIHCNEIVLLAYYIAAVNIENTFHDLLGKDATYLAFEGICLTDTFQLGETKKGEIQYEEMFHKNSERVEKQQKAPLRIIMGNPPYSVGQKSADDNSQNQVYNKLDNRISQTYQAIASGTGKRALYDAYIKAFRWSTDRLDKTGGIICFVSNSSWLDGIATAGFRLCLEKEFTSIYVFNLRGNQRTSGELSRKEGGKIFGSGSRTPIAITLLVKNPDVKTDKATIHYIDIGDYLNREEKLKIVSAYKSFDNEKLPIKTILPNEHGDWLSMRNDGFENFIPLGSKDKQSTPNSNTFFKPLFSSGILTARDSWVWNFNSNNLKQNVKNTIEFYSEELLKFQEAKKTNPNLIAKNFISYNAKKISWDNRRLIGGIDTNKKIDFDDSNLRVALYRPFCKQSIYFSLQLSHSLYLQKNYFPTSNSFNLVICTSVQGSTTDFSVLITNQVVEYAMGQCFPLYYYEENTSIQKGMFDEDNKNDYIRRDAISDFILEQAKKLYGKNVVKEDIFYYVYGFLHNKEYRETFANDLKKMLPRLPLVEDVKDFWKFSKAGRTLAELHLNYETVAPAEKVKVTYLNKDVYDAINFIGSGLKESDYLVDPKMKFPPKKDQKDTIIYNSKITISNIPAQAYEYIVNGKSAIEWIIERYQVTTHKESGIINNANDWATEVGNPRYILDLLLSVINVSVQTVDIVKSLPKLEFGIPATENEVEKTYPDADENEDLSIAAEPNN